jgi:tRNA (guanine10-N2)-methyltransferase
MNGSHTNKAFQPQCWLGRHLVSCVEGPAIVASLALKDRPFMSPTAMPPLQAAIMANCALIQKGFFSWDPFCGSGSIMLMCAKMGADLTFGSDMDWRYFKTGQSNAKQGGSKEANLRENFVHYGLLQPLLVRADVGNLPFRPLCIDAIVCDPPYGIRAGTLDTSASGKQEMLEIIGALLKAAAIHLRIGGRLVFWQPTTEYDDFSDEVMHPALRLLYAPLELIHEKSWSRRLVVMEKVTEYEDGMEAVLPEKKEFKRQKTSD